MIKTFTMFVSLMLLLMVSAKPSYATFNICNIFPWLPQCQPQEEECDEGYIWDEEEEECVEEQPQPTPTPTPEPEATPTAQTDTPVFGGSYNPAQCNGVPSGKPAWKHVDRVDSDSIWLEWANGNDTEKVSILYGLVGGGLDYSVLDLPKETTFRTINDLQPDKSYNFQILNWRNNCVIGSDILDP